MLGILVFSFLVGICLGSFVKVWADRSIKGQSILGRSYCPKCKKTLRWYDLFPILSYLLTGGKCRYCHKKIGIYYPLVEVAMGILTAVMAAKFIPADYLSMPWPSQSLIILEVIFNVFVLCVLMTLFLTDLETGYIYDRITYPAIVIALSYLVLSTAYKIYLTYAAIKGSLIGQYLLPPHSDYLYRHALTTADPLFSGCISAVILALFFGGLIFLTRGRGMGGGDLKLGVFIGLVLGFPRSILGIFLSFIFGSLVGIVLILSRRKNLRQTIPFGPFLAVGTMIALLWGNQIIDWWFKYSVL